MPGHDTPDPTTILPPEIEAARQQMLAATHQMALATKTALDAKLGRPLSQEAYDYLVALAAHVRASMDHVSNNPPISWTTLDIPDDRGDPADT